MPMEGSTLVFSDIIGAVTSLVGNTSSGAVSWILKTVTMITGNALLSFWALLGLVGVGIGLYHRLAR